MPAIRRWTVRSDPVGCGWFAWFYVYIYETDIELRKAARKYRNESINGNFFTDSLAVFQPSLTIKYDKKGNPKRCAKTAFIGVMRLSMESLEPHIIIHECTHAAVHYVAALKLRPRYYILGESIANEEALCYAAHEFSIGLLKKLDMVI